MVEMMGFHFASRNIGFALKRSARPGDEGAQRARDGEVSDMAMTAKEIEMKYGVSTTNRKETSNHDVVLFHSLHLTFISRQRLIPGAEGPIVAMVGKIVEPREISA